MQVSLEGREITVSTSLQRGDLSSLFDPIWTSAHVWPGSLLLINYLEEIKVRALIQSNLTNTTYMCASCARSFSIARTHVSTCVVALGARRVFGRHSHATQKYSTHTTLPPSHTALTREPSTMNKLWPCAHLTTVTDRRRDHSRARQRVRSCQHMRRCPGGALELPQPTPHAHSHSPSFSY